ncbi:MAG: glycosyltransferase family 2 protein [Balneolales bacterium]
MSAKISVIIPTFNRAQIISRSIKSVLNQTFQDFEIWIIDDASTDDTKKVVTSFKEQKIRYHQLKENSGGAIARNVGIELSEGEFVAFLDSDDEWQPTMLESCLDRYESLNIQDLIIFSKLLMDNKVTKKVFPENIYQGGDLSEYIFCQQGLVSTITLFMPKYVAKNLMFKEGLIKHQDYDFVLRAYREKVKFTMIDKVLAVWYCERRPDRMGQKIEYEISFEWMINNLNLFTHRSAKAFINRDVIPQINKDKYSLKALLFLFMLLNKKYVTINVFVKAVLRTLTFNPVIVLRK